MIMTFTKGIALISSLLLGGAPFGSSEEAPQETVAAAAADQGAAAVDATGDPIVLDLEEFQLTGKEREQVAESSVKTIEDKAGHDLVNIEFNDDTVVLRPVESFDEQNDQEYFSEIMDALKTLGYENIAAVGKPVYVEQAPEFDLESLTAEKDIDIEAVALPEVDPTFSHVIRA